MREYLPPYSQGPEGAGIGDKYANFIGRELMPYIENEILAGRPIHRRVIAGASMGGLISLYFSNLSTPWMAKRFDAIMAFSPSIQFSEILSELQHFEGRIYIDSGSTGPGFDHYQEVNFLRDLLLNRGLVFGRDLLHIVGVGHAHQELFWRTRLQENLSWAFNP
jgi:hypothetical protein